MVKPEQTSRRIGLHSTMNSNGCANGLLETNISSIPTNSHSNGLEDISSVALAQTTRSVTDNAAEPEIAATEPAIAAADDALAQQFQAAVPNASEEQVNRSGSAHTTFKLTWNSSDPIPIDTQTRVMLESILRQIEADEKIAAEKKSPTNKN